MRLKGKVWKLGDQMKAGGDIMPTRYDHLGMSAKWDELGKHVFEDCLPTLVAKMEKGDLVIAGDNFGSGHAHFIIPAIKAMQAAGLAGCIAESFPGAFQRMAINAGFPAIEAHGIAQFAEMGDEVEIDLLIGQVVNHTQRTRLSLKPVPQMIVAILGEGGLEAYALERLRPAGAAQPVPAQ